ncbi:MAG: hypothetical protein F7B06_02790 [Opitutae bacterium]|nr:hypothetical protein [Opitutae bacterium]MBC9888782.1 hypothetical protein [Opitutae bacterium]
MKSPDNNPGPSWSRLVSASRKESPAPVDVRYRVRVELEKILRLPRKDEVDWVEALINLFSPNLVKVGVAAALVSLLLVTAVVPVENEGVLESEDPLITLLSGEGEWSDWL